MDAAKFDDTIGPSRTRSNHDFKLRPLGFSYFFIHVPAFLDTGLPRGNVHEWDSGPVRGAIPTQSLNP